MFNENVKEIVETYIFAVGDFRASDGIKFEGPQQKILSRMEWKVK